MADSRNSTQISGHLSDFQIVELMQAVGMGNSTGALHLSRPDGRRGILYFQEGMLTWCREYDSQALTLGAVLQQMGWVQGPDIEAIYQRLVQDPLGDLLGQALVERNKLSPQRLAEALRIQLLWSVREMALWTNGDYHFNYGETPPPRTAEQRIDVSRASLEIVRYQYEWNDLRQWLPDAMHTQLRMALQPPPNRSLVFTAADWRIVTRVNAFQTPRRIATALGSPEMEMARRIAPLVSDGYLYASVAEHSIGLPAVARPTNANTVNIFGLLSRMEQEWIKRHNTLDQLSALAMFVNWTIDALAEVWAQNGLPFAPDSLSSMLAREGLDTIAGQPIRVERNHIATDALARTLQAVIAQARQAGDSQPIVEAYEVLSRALRAVFVANNMRVDSPQDRTYNVAAWQAMFEQFSQSLQVL